MRPTYSPTTPRPMSATPIRKKAMANRVNRPSASGPTIRRRITRYTTRIRELSAITPPAMEKNCSGATENPVIRSKLSRMSRYREYLVCPTARSPCVTSISTGWRGHVGAHLGAVVERIDHAAMVTAQHAALIGDADRGGSLAQAIHQPRGRLAPQHVLAALADGADVVRAGVHGGDQSRDLLGRVLQVGIQCDHVSAVRVRKGG